MAVFTSSKTQYQFYLKLTMEETAAGAYNAQPQVSYKLQLYSGGWNFSLLRINAHVKLGGTVIAQLNATDKQWTLDTKSSITLLSGTASVPYDGSGSLSVEYAIFMDKAVWQYAPNIEATGTMPLTPYAQPASVPSLSASSVELGKAVTIYANRKDAYTHTISYTFGSASGIIANNVGDSVAWSPPVDLASQLPNDTTGICVITCETFSNGEPVGKKTVNLELTVPASVVPTISAFTATRVDNGVPSAWGIYVKGYSKVRLQTTAAGAYGSTIQSCTVSGEQPGADVTTGVLNTAGEKQFSVTVKDSRGRSATASVTINVVDYVKPSISGVNFARCDADGTDNDDGTGIKAHGAIVIASCEGKNSYTAQVQYKLSTASSWNNAGAYSGGNTSAYAVGLTDATYDVRIAVTDGLNTVYATNVLDVGDVIAEYHKDTGVVEFHGPVNFGEPDTTRANLGAAPAGYGLGTTAKKLSNTKLDSVLSNGWYCFDSGSGIENAPQDFPSMLFVENFYNTGWCKQTITLVGHAKTKIVRSRHKGTWGEWEYENPLMELGKEYRTTERWQDKAVYTKLVSFGAMPNKGSLMLPSTLKSSEIQMVEDSFMGYKTGGPFLSMPFFGTDGSINARAHVSSDNNVYIDTFVDFSSYTLVAKFKYIKV